MDAEMDAEIDAEMDAWCHHMLKLCALKQIFGNYSVEIRSNNESMKGGGVIGPLKRFRV